MIQILHLSKRMRAAQHKLEISVCVCVVTSPMDCLVWLPCVFALIKNLKESKLKWIHPSYASYEILR